VSSWAAHGARLSDHAPFGPTLGEEALEIRMAYQAVNRAIAGNTEAGQGWQETVARHLTEEMSSPPPPPVDMFADKARAASTASDQPDAIAIIQRVSGLSIGELDKTIQELQNVRNFLVSEEERMRRDIAEYLKLTQSSIRSMRAMSANIANIGSVISDAAKAPNS
jgi:hypothetical protein